MVVIGLVGQFLAILNGFLGHFVSGGIASLSETPDYEWQLGQSHYAMTMKGNYLMGAVADITTFGAILVDWLVQALLGTGTTLNQAPL